ncbi:hypothetical protein SLA2020_451220 [Shorea laevis]
MPINLLLLLNVWCSSCPWEWPGGTSAATRCSSSAAPSSSPSPSASTSPPTSPTSPTSPPPYPPSSSSTPGSPASPSSTTSFGVPTIGLGHGPPRDPFLHVASRRSPRLTPPICSMALGSSSRAIPRRGCSCSRCSTWFWVPSHGLGQGRFVQAAQRLSDQGN